MASAADRGRNSLRAGLFVVSSLALGLAVFFTLQKFSFAAKSSYRIRFSVESGVGGLGQGSEVRIGGLRRGEVTGITPVMKNGALDQLDVDIGIDAAITIFQNARAMRMAPILGSAAWINFVSVGGPIDIDGDGKVEPVARLAPGETLNASEAPGLLSTILGGKSAEQVVGIIDRASTFSEVLPEIPKDYREKLVPALDAASTTIVKLRDDYDRWRVKVDETLTSAANAAKELETGVKSATQLVADARATLAENRPRIGNAMINLESATGTAKEAVEEIRQTTLPQISKALSEGERAIGELADLIERVDTEVATRMPDIRAFIGDARVAAQQLKLATIEVRRSPWRLLYQPTTDVLANEQLYEATRTFAMATGDLRSATDAVTELLKTRPDLFDSDPSLRARLQSSIVDALARYEEAQRRLYGVLTTEH